MSAEGRRLTRTTHKSAAIRERVKQGITNGVLGQRRLWSFDLYSAVDLPKRGANGWHDNLSRVVVFGLAKSQSTVRVALLGPKGLFVVG